LKEKFHQFQFNFYKEREMSDFRKLFLAFVVVALMLGTVASAQVTPPVTCNTTAQPLTARAEGLAEQVGDTIIQCTGGAIPTLGSILPQVNISISLSTNITSRLLADPITEALLFIDDPQPGAQNPCAPAQGSTVCSPLTAGPGGTALDGAGVVRNVFQGVRQNDNTIVFQAVPINAPGTAAIRVYRIKNVRAAVAGASAPNGQIFAFISIQNPPANLQLNQSTVTVAFVQQGLAFAVRSRTGGTFDAASTGGVLLFQCETFNRDLANANTNRFVGGSLPGGGSYQLRFREGYAASWKVRDVNLPLVEPGAQQNFPQNNNGASSPGRFTVESGFYNTQFTSINGLNRAGRADHGTRLRVGFGAVPANVRIFVSAAALPSSNTPSTDCPSGIAVNSSTSAQTCVTGETSARVTAYGVATDSRGANVAAGTVLANPLSDGLLGAANTGGAANQIFFPPAAVTQGLVEVPITSGAGSFTWEIFNEDPNSIDTASFLVVLAFRSVNNPGLGTMTVNGSFAPLSTVNTMNAGAPLPRFADTSTATNTASLNVCQTNLLFPFVTNQAGFDTGLAIANTTQDPFGTSAQAGNCQLYYYGASSGGGAAPAPQTTTATIAAGETLLLSLSSGGTKGIQSTPGFQGYMIATCNFRLAHGFAFISDLGAQRLSHGYLALVLDNNGIITRTALPGEGLGQ
jgi:hypothetical protein